MGGWADKLSFGDSGNAAFLSGVLSIIQFSIETIVLICLSVYIIPFSSVAKTFYSLAALGAPLLIVISIFFVYGLSQDKPSWMVPWLFSYLIVSLCEVIITLIAFASLNGLHDIFNFYANAWALTHFYANNQLIIGTYTSTSCTVMHVPFIHYNTEGVYAAAMIVQQGAQGFIAGFVLLLILKNITNVYMIIVSFAHYRILKEDNGRRKTYGVQRRPRFHDPHHRPRITRRREQSSSVNTVY